MKNPFPELRAFLAHWAAELRARRDYRTILDVEALHDITADIGRHLQAAADLAHSARCSDDEALRLITRITAPDSPGGAQITTAELPDLVKATRHIRRSAEADHRLAEHYATA